jgi:microcystin-dependent protein/Ca2+-binding RTX toxin-like protein
MPINNLQPSLVLSRLLTTTGVFPSQSTDGGTPMATIRTFGGNFGMNQAPFANGQIFNIASNAALFTILGTQYGGNGQTTFALPNLDGKLSFGNGQGPGLSDRVIGEQIGSDTITLQQSQLPTVVGGSALGASTIQPTLTTTYLIRTEGIFPSQNGGGGSINLIGTIVQFAGNFTPAGYMEANGQLLPIAQHTALFSIIGTTYGGDGMSTFALPDLRGRTIVGANGNRVLGETFGSEATPITQANLPVNMGGSGVPIDNHQPSIALNYIIALQGIFPSQDGGFHEDVPILSEILIFAGNFAPAGYALTNGQFLPINQNQALFALLGTNFGGNGQTTFALPDLRDRAIVGEGPLYSVGQTLGSATATLTSADMPSLVYSGTAADNTLYGGDAADNISGLAGSDTMIGNGGDDQLNGGLGNNIFNGGAGTDLAIMDYGDRVGAITFTLDVPANLTTILVGGVGAGTLTGIEAINITTGSGNEVMFGAGGDDTFNTGAGSDRARGRGGADRFFGGDGVDVLQGDDGDDVVNGENDADYLYGGAGQDQLSGGAGNDNMFGDAGNDSASGGDGVDQILGDAGNDTLNGGLGDDYVYGEGDNDTLFGSDGNDRLYGGLGADVINGGGDVDVLVGQDGDDTLNGDGGLDYVYGGNGADTINGGDADDVLQGEADNDAISGGNGDDNIYGQGGIDSLSGNVGTDIIFGGDGGDTLNGNEDNDVLIGEAGNDIANGGAGIDYLYGGGDDDTLNGDAGADQLFGDIGADTLNGGADGDTLLGEDGSDALFGGTENDYLYGGAGTDTLVGDAGADFLYGGADGDTLSGGAGADVLRGEAGADFFVMTTGGGNDLVVDFQDGIDLITVGTADSLGTISIGYFGEGALITFSGGETMFLLGAANGSITGADFLFVP